jgi:hypothetical protein
VVSLNELIRGGKAYLWKVSLLLDAKTGEPVGMSRRHTRAMATSRTGAACDVPDRGDPHEPVAFLVRSAVRDWLGGVCATPHIGACIKFLRIQAHERGSLSAAKMGSLASRYGRGALAISASVRAVYALAALLPQRTTQVPFRHPLPKFIRLGWRQSGPFFRGRRVDRSRLKVGSVHAGLTSAHICCALVRTRQSHSA